MLFLLKFCEQTDGILCPLFRNTQLARFLPDKKTRCSGGCAAHQPIRTRLATVRSVAYKKQKSVG
jgi:hypothetical protein